MNIIIEGEVKKQRYIPHEVQTRYHAVYLLRSGCTPSYICRKYHISRSSLWRWDKKYNGTKESLCDISHKPKSKHPNAHTEEELRWINNYLKRNPHITLCELWYKLKLNRGYTRHPASLYRFLRSIGFYSKFLKQKKKYIPKPYDTPKDLGIKWQIDVKFVPNHCYTGTDYHKKFFQYTCIDEASRERFIYHYDEHTPRAAIDFVYRCLLFYGYKPKEIQTDNGYEFSWTQQKQSKNTHPFTALCIKERIIHHKIRPRTPRHNGKVERSHRSDNERFYSYLTFYSLSDLRIQASSYLKRSNNIPMAILNYKTPNEYRLLLETN